MVCEKIGSLNFCIAVYRTLVLQLMTSKVRLKILVCQNHVLMTALTMRF
jgi:hypothetical protein